MALWMFYTLYLSSFTVNLLQESNRMSFDAAVYVWFRGCRVFASLLRRD